MTHLFKENLFLRKPLYKLLYIIQFNSLKLLKIINLTFQILWKSLLYPCLLDFLLFNFKLVLSLLCKDLSKYRHCHIIILLQTLDCDGNISRPLALNFIKKKSKGSFSKYFKNLRHSVSLLDNMKCQNEWAKRRSYYQ